MSPWRQSLISPLCARRPRQGFTLIELLVVVLLIGILAAIALPRFLGQRTRAKNAAAGAAVRHGLLAARSYYTQNGESYAGLGSSQLQGYESSLGSSEPADTVKPGDAAANPQNIWIGNGLDGTNPTAGDANSGNTVVLCSTSRGDTVSCWRDSNGRTASWNNSASGATPLNTATNLVTNHSLETNTSGWQYVGSGSTWSMTSVAASWNGSSGSRALRVTYNAAAGEVATIRSDAITVNPGASYTALATNNVLSQSATGRSWLSIWWIDAGGTNVSSAYSEIVTSAGVHYFTATGVAPATAVSARLALVFQAQTSPGTLDAYWDDLALYPGAGS